jgi:hypothetical protein
LDHAVRGGQPASEHAEKFVHAGALDARDPDDFPTTKVERRRMDAHQPAIIENLGAIKARHHAAPLVW